MTASLEIEPPGSDQAIIEHYLTEWEHQAHALPAAIHGECTIDEVTRPYVAIAREVGTGAAELAAAVGGAFGWPVINRRLTNTIALNETLRERLLRSLEPWTAHAVTQRVADLHCGDDYGRWVSEVILSIAARTPLVALGRGATFILPRRSGLRVRLTAPAHYRAARLAATGDLDLADAEAQIRRIDDERRTFARTQFGVNIDDVSRYDLVIDREEFTMEQIIEQVVHAVTAKTGVRPAEPDPSI